MRKGYKLEICLLFFELILNDTKSKQKQKKKIKTANDLFLLVGHTVCSLHDFKIQILFFFINRETSTIQNTSGLQDI